MQLSSVHVGKTIVAREHQDGRIEDAPGFTIADMLDSVRQGTFDRTQVTDTVECGYIENIGSPNDGSGRYTILLRGGHVLESDDRVQLKVLKPYKFWLFNDKLLVATRKKKLGKKPM